MKAEGALATLFGNPNGRAIAKILDHAVLTGNMEQSVQSIASATGLNYKTVQRSLEKLLQLGIVGKGRRLGGAQTFKFNVEANLQHLIRFARLLALTPYERAHRLPRS